MRRKVDSNLMKLYFISTLCFALVNAKNATSSRWREKSNIRNLEQFDQNTEKYTCNPQTSSQNISKCGLVYGTAGSPINCDYIIQQLPGTCGIEIELIDDLRNDCGSNVGHGSFILSNGLKRNQRKGVNLRDLCEEPGRHAGKRISMKFIKENPIKITHKGPINYRAKVDYLCCNTEETSYGDRCCKKESYKEIASSRQKSPSTYSCLSYDLFHSKPVAMYDEGNIKSNKYPYCGLYVPRTIIVGGEIIRNCKIFIKLIHSRCSYDQSLLLRGPGSYDPGRDIDLCKKQAGTAYNYTYPDIYDEEPFDGNVWILVENGPDFNIQIKFGRCPSSPDYDKFTTRQPEVSTQAPSTSSKWVVSTESQISQSTPWWEHTTNSPFPESTPWWEHTTNSPLPESTPWWEHSTESPFSASTPWWGHSTQSPFSASTPWWEHSTQSPFSASTPWWGHSTESPSSASTPWWEHSTHSPFSASTPWWEHSTHSPFTASTPWWEQSTPTDEDTLRPWRPFTDLTTHKPWSTSENPWWHSTESPYRSTSDYSWWHSTESLYRSTSDYPWWHSTESPYRSTSDYPRWHTTESSYRSTSDYPWWLSTHDPWWQTTHNPYWGTSDNPWWHTTYSPYWSYGTYDPYYGTSYSPWSGNRNKGQQSGRKNAGRVVWQDNGESETCNTNAGYKINQNPLVHMTALDIPTCCYLCARNKVCQGWTHYDKSHGKRRGCYLFKSNVFVKVKEGNGIVSGVPSNKQGK